MKSATKKRSKPNPKPVPTPIFATYAGAKQGKTSYAAKEPKPRVRSPEVRNSFVARVRATFQKGNRLAATAGCVWGGAIPLGVFSIVHALPEQPLPRAALLTAAAGGLAFSAFSVYEAGRSAFGSKLKAVGFVVLMEGMMTLAQLLSVKWVAWTASIAALAVLVAANAVNTAVNLVTEDRRARRENK